jgi:hypothetical protein
MSSILLFFVLSFFIGLVIPFFLLKVKRKGAVWIPSLLLFICTVLMAIKAYVFPGAGMADLGEIVYMMILGISTGGSIIGALAVSLINSGRTHR